MLSDVVGFAELDRLLIGFSYYCHYSIPQKELAGWLPMNNKKITKAFVDSKLPTGKYRDPELKGFGLKVTPAGSKVYFVENVLKGSRQAVTVTIGKHGPFTAEQARVAAKDILAMLAKGINPNEVKRQTARQAEEQAVKESQAKQSQALTLRRVFTDYITGTQLKDSTAYGYLKILMRCLSDWWELPIVEISKSMVSERHQQLSKHKAQANLCMRVLRAIFTFAEDKYLNDNNEPLITTNPVRKLSWNRVDRRKTMIQPHELKAWYAAVMRLDNTSIRDYLRLLLFTGLRKNEAAGLRWENVDFKAGTLLVKDTKNHEDHILPMTPFVRNLLLERWQCRNNDFVFPGTGKAGYLNDPRKQMAHITKQSAVIFTLHDLRRTFLSIAESLDIPHYTLKRLANHKDSTDVTSGYIVSGPDRLKPPLRKISDYLQRKIGIRQQRSTRKINHTKTAAMHK